MNTLLHFLLENPVYLIAIKVGIAGISIFLVVATFIRIFSRKIENRIYPARIQDDLNAEMNLNLFLAVLSVILLIVSGLLVFNILFFPLHLLVMIFSLYNLSDISESKKELKMSGLENSELDTTNNDEEFILKEQR